MNLPSKEQKAAAVEAMFDTISPRYDLLNRILTFRLDVRWRRMLIRAMSLESGSTVADLACGTGDFCRDLESAGHRPIGLDFSEGMLRHARTSAPLVRADIQRIPLSDSSVDAATCGFALRNVDRISDVFAEMARVVRPGGRLGIIEVSTPRNRILAAGHAVWFKRMVPLIGGLFSDRAAYAYLPESVAYLPPTHELVEMLSNSGFSGIETRQLAGGAAQWIVATRS